MRFTGSDRAVAPLLAALLLLSGMSRPAGAQTAINVSLGGTAAAPTLTGDGTTAVAKFDLKKGANIRVTCVAPITCDDAQKPTLFDVAARKDAGVVASPVRNGVIEFALPQNTTDASVTYSFEVVYQSHHATPPIQLSGTPGGGGASTNAQPGSETGAVSLIELLSTACDDREFSDYDFVVRPDGSVIHRPGRRLDESDDVRVIVYGDARLVPRLRVTRESKIRVPKLTNIFGANVEIPGVGDLNKQAAEAPTCEEQRYELGDFAPGTALIDISVITDKGYVSTGKVEFLVAELFTGSFSLGAVHTTVAAPTFGTVFDGTDTVVTETGTRGRRLLYVLQYTPYVWGMRDLTLIGGEAAIYPTVGLVLNDVPNNGLAGVSLELGGRISATWGIHAARVTELDPNANLALGAKYTPSTRGATVPTVKHWTYKPFVGVAIDLQAAADFLRTALGTVTKGATQ